MSESVAGGSVTPSTADRLFPNIVEDNRRALNWHEHRSAPEWWRELARKQLDGAEVSPEVRAFVEAQFLDSETTVEALVHQIDDIVDPVESVFTTFAILQELDPSLKSLKTQLQDVLERDLQAVSANENDYQHGAVNGWLKAYFRIRVAASLWASGKKSDAESWNRNAYSMFRHPMTFYYDLPAFNGIMVFAEAGQPDLVWKMPIAANGQIKLSHLRGDRAYVGLTSPTLGNAGVNHSEASEGDLFSALCHAELALAASKISDRDKYVIHYRRTNELLEKKLRIENPNLKAFIESSIQSRLAIAEAHQGKWTLALGRLKNQIKHPFFLPEAGGQLGMLQLKTASDSNVPGYINAKKTLELFDSHPRSVFLVQEIAAAQTADNLVAAAEWVERLENPVHRVAGFRGIERSLRNAEE